MVIIVKDYLVSVNYFVGS